MKKIIFALFCLLLLWMCSCDDTPSNVQTHNKPVKKAITPGMCVSDTTYKLTEWSKSRIYVDGKSIIVYEYKFKGHWYEAHTWGWNDSYSEPKHSVRCDCMWMD